MKCRICGGYVEWKGPLTALTHTEHRKPGAERRIEMTTTRKALWIVSRNHGWDCLRTQFGPLAPAPGGPQFFIPVFETKSDAIKWNGSKKHIMKVWVEKDMRLKKRRTK